MTYRHRGRALTMILEQNNIPFIMNYCESSLFSPLSLACEVLCIAFLTWPADIVEGEINR